MAVTFINALSVPDGREREFIEKWDEGADYVRSQPGFISTSLHRTLDRSSRYQFYTIAVWETPEQFIAATSTDWWRAFVDAFGFGDGPEDYRAEPALCERVR